MRDRVLLLHGLAASSRSLRRLERAIVSEGYETLNLAYPSCRMRLADLVEQVHAQRDWIAHPNGRTHIVTYSMGGLLARGYIARHRPPNLGRVVMLAPPNGGSEVADLLAENFLYRCIFGPVGAELTTNRPESVAQLLGNVDYPLGVIAGNRFIDPLGWLFISGPNDGRVSVERTKVYGMTDHVTIPASHFAMMRNKSAFRYTIHFLKHGRFS
jgi:pimeloyl-ACP methyl ester carboxylesterase